MTSEVSEQFAVVHRVSSILAKQVSVEELPYLLSTVVKGLNDNQANSSSGACVVFNGMWVKSHLLELTSNIGLLKVRGEEMKDHVRGIVNAVLKVSIGTSMSYTHVSVGNGEHQQRANHEWNAALTPSVG